MNNETCSECGDSEIYCYIGFVASEGGIPLCKQCGEKHMKALDKRRENARKEWEDDCEKRGITLADNCACGNSIKDDSTFARFMRINPNLCSCCMAQAGDEILRLMQSREQEKGENGK